MSSSFVVEGGSLAGSYDRVLLATDLEPDDAIAILMLAPRLRGVPMLVVVGEGDVDKCTMAAEMLASLGLGQACVTIVQGKMSTARFPDGVVDVYRGATTPAHECTIRDGGEATVNLLVEEFLAAAVSPFAMLLKPPHELLVVPEVLLRKTRAAIYGSFNLTELRAGITEGRKADEDELHQQQFELMSSFGTLLWIERSVSVGRDCTIEPQTCPPGIWRVLDSNPGLSRHIQLWNSQTVRSIADKMTTFHVDVEAALGSDGAGLPAAPDPERYGKLEPAIDKVDKRVRILMSIVACRGRQVCHADTLVAAALLDDDGTIAAFERKCKLEVDAKQKPTFALDPTSSVIALVATAGDQRDALIRASFEVINRALGGEVQ